LVNHVPKSIKDDYLVVPSHGFARFPLQDNEKRSLLSPICDGQSGTFLAESLHHLDTLRMRLLV